MTRTRPVSPPLLGADISMLARMDQVGAYGSNGSRVDVLSQLRCAGFSACRLRLFHSPSGDGAQVNDLDYTRALAKRCVDAGMSLLLCPHYSDTWADPGKQYPPAAWRDLSFSALVREVESYTAHVVSELRRDGCCPTITQLGNEITGGMLWDHGQLTSRHHINDLNWDADEIRADQNAWDRFGELLHAAERGVRRGSDGRSRVMVHIDRGGDEWAAVSFFEQLLQRGLSVDCIGLSYYPFWHGTIPELTSTIDRLHAKFGMPVHVVETAFPYTGHPIYNGADLSETAFAGIERTREVQHDLTPEGQRAFVSELLDAMRSRLARGWHGLWYWAPEWIESDGYADEPDASACWARALFDRHGRALPALHEIQRFAHEAMALPEILVRRSNATPSVS